MNPCFIFNKPRSMSEKIQVVTGGASASTLLGVAFVILKLCGVINWSWWLVTVPFWWGLALAALIFSAIAVAALVSWVLVIILSATKGRKNK